jgi:mevalonate pyrophosphate decarboxylase
MTEFYRQRIAKLEKQIKMAELERDFKKVAKLQAEKSE